MDARAGRRPSPDRADVVRAGDRTERRVVEGDGGQRQRSTLPNPASEPVLAAQARVLDEALSALEDERSNVTDLYFVGFAADAREDVFRKDVVAAQK
jgi:hypothetical protein